MPPLITRHLLPGTLSASSLTHGDPCLGGCPTGAWAHARRSLSPRPLRPFQGCLTVAPESAEEPMISRKWGADSYSWPSRLRPERDPACLGAPSRNAKTLPSHHPAGFSPLTHCGLSRLGQGAHLWPKRSLYLFLEPQTMNMDDGGQVQFSALSLNDWLAKLPLPGQSRGQGSNTSTLFPLGLAQGSLEAVRRS